MDREECIALRVDDQVSCYDTQSKSGRPSFKSLSSIQIVSGILIYVI